MYLCAIQSNIKQHDPFGSFFTLLQSCVFCKKKKENQHPVLELIRVAAQCSAQLWFHYSIASKTDRLDCYAEHWFEDREYSTGRERWQLLCYPWHGFTFGLWADTFLSVSHTHFSKTETLAARGVWRHTLTQTHKHTQRATLISCLALLSGERHSWGDPAILWTTGHTNKQYSLFLSSLINIFTTFYRQTFTSRKVCEKQTILIISPSQFHFDLSYLLLSTPALSHCLYVHLPHPLYCMYLSVSISLRV